MQGPLMEVKSAVVQTYEGEQVEVYGGAYLPPETVLATSAELTRLRESKQASSSVMPSLLVGAAVMGLAVGFWLGRRDDD
jgi:hypothetical protein